MFGLDQLCAAAMEPGLSEPGAGPAAEIKVQEVDAYASVADLIQAAITANNGAATLKEIYDVCERHGRIAYRRAGGSRLITANEHWKSQIRHALYTGSRFKRVPSNAEYWQLVNPDHAMQAELVKVLVRADDSSSNVYASLTLSPTGTGSGTALAAAEHPQAPAVHKGRSGGRSRGKRGHSDDEEEPEYAGVEGMSDTADLEAAAAAPSRQGVTRRFSRPRRPALISREIEDPSDNYSTQHSDDEFKELPRPRSNRRKPASNLRPAPHPTAAAAVLPVAGPIIRDRPRHTHMAAYRNINPTLRTYNPMTVATTNNNNTGSGNSDEPTTLRWGSTSLRSSVLIADDVSFSVGRGTPGAGARRILLNRDRSKTPSAEADSPLNNVAKGVSNRDPRNPAGGMKQVAVHDAAVPPSKRRASVKPAPVVPPAYRNNNHPIETPDINKEELAHISPPLNQQLTIALRQMQEAMAKNNAQMMGADAWPMLMAMPPPHMLPLMPAMMAAAAPFFNNHESQQQIMQQMQSIMLNAGAAEGPRNQQDQTWVQQRQA